MIEIIEEETHFNVEITFTDGTRKTYMHFKEDDESIEGDLFIFRGRVSSVVPIEDSLFIIPWINIQMVEIYEVGGDNEEN